MTTAVKTVRLNEEELSLLQKAADFYGMSVSKFLKFSAKKEAEDAIDIAIAKEVLAKNEPTITWEEFEKEFGEK